MASRKSRNIHILKFHREFSSLLIKDTSLLISSYIDELRNGRKFECDNKHFIVFVLIIRSRVLF